MNRVVYVIIQFLERKNMTWVRQERQEKRASRLAGFRVCFPCTRMTRTLREASRFGSVS